MRKIISFFLTATLMSSSFSLGFGILINSSATNALSGSEFNAGRIIDDSVFYNSNTMTSAQIQQFLNSKVPVCDTNGIQSYGGTTRAAYGASRGNPAPFTCLKDYTQSVPATINSGSNLCSGSITAGTKSAAQIILDVSNACGINPQVLIVLLQKEQSLITDDWPWNIQYRSATGYGCPDTAPCDAEYYGFFNQVYQAAKAFKRYAANPNSYNYKANRNNSILYQANNPGCGSSNVFIQNQATANLYIYTPYQPNQAALDNLYGLGNSCSAYGNRNFWRMFNDWFGAGVGVKPYVNLKWNFEYLDGSTPSVRPNASTVGGDPNTISHNNKLYTFYYDSTSQDLLMSYADNTGWNFEVLDGQGGINGRIDASVGSKAFSTIHNDEVHVFYYDQTNTSLRHAWLDATGTTWNFETLDGSASSIAGFSADVGNGSTALSYGQSLQLFYYDKTNGNLRHAWLSPSSNWRFENLDGDYGSVGRYNSDLGSAPVAVAHTNGIQLFYYDSGHGNLRHAWTTPRGWKFEVLDGDASAVSRQTSNVGVQITAQSIASGGGLQLFYYDSAQGDLRHAWTTSQGWKFEDLDGDTKSVSKQNLNVGAFPQSIVHNNELYVFYRDAGGGDMRYAWANSTGWSFATLEGSIHSTSGNLNDTGYGTTVTTHNSSLQTFYFDNTARALRHTWGNPL